ncbi:hypothetical protein B5X24_HaOG214681 [Helicoverpa armigera]|uniref:Uncharacterized protein n=1 Tax=Helicoverpa armigera TaxID=29058 RepID=A0A2W1B4N9_HELAM|nr:hypothetical protein B5X24_HaOG214681 [Helicoverpa armigera]
MVPVISLDTKANNVVNNENKTQDTLKYLPFIMLIDKDMDTSEYWRETEILSLVRNNEVGIDYDKCEQSALDRSVVQINSLRTVRPICRTRIERKSYMTRTVPHL